VTALDESEKRVRGLSVFCSASKAAINEPTSSLSLPDKGSDERLRWTRATTNAGLGSSFASVALIGDKHVAYDDRADTCLHARARIRR
jgi:hypothetical protein